MPDPQAANIDYVPLQSIRKTLLGVCLHYWSLKLNSCMKEAK